MMISIHLSSEIESRLQSLAAVTGRSKNALAAEAIIEHLDDLEDLYLAEQRLIDSREGRSEAAPLEDVMKDLGLGDGDLND